jgi:hypothetical protein
MGAGGLLKIGTGGVEESDTSTVEFYLFSNRALDLWTAEADLPNRTWSFPTIYWDTGSVDPAGDLARRQLRHEDLSRQITEFRQGPLRSLSFVIESRAICRRAECWPTLDRATIDVESEVDISSLYPG